MSDKATREEIKKLTKRKNEKKKTKKKKKIPEELPIPDLKFFIAELKMAPVLFEAKPGRERGRKKERWWFRRQQKQQEKKTTTKTTAT